jgi:ribosomal protein L10
VKREDKERIVAGLREKFTHCEVAILTRYSGLRVEEINGLRNELRKVSVDYHVVKNTLANRAMEGTDVAMLRDHLQGPLAIALTRGDIVHAAKLLTAFAKDHPRLEIYMGMAQGRVLDANVIEKAAKLPSKEELVAKLMSVMNAPLVQMISVMREVVAKFMRTLNAIQQQKANSV